MNDAKEKNDTFFCRLLELMNLPNNNHGLRKLEIKKEYSRRYDKISVSRVGGAVDILVGIGLVEEDKRTGLFKLSSLGKKILTAMEQKKTSLVELLGRLMQ